MALPFLFTRHVFPAPFQQGLQTAYLQLLSHFFPLRATELGVRAFYNEADSPVYHRFTNPEWKQFRIFRSDKDLFWTCRIDATIGGINPVKGNYQIRINREGFRGPDLDDPSRSDANRIMFSGDSCVFGWNAPAGKTFPGRLLHHLSKEHPQEKFHSYQPAAPGYSSYQVKVAVKKYLPLDDPQLLVIWCGSNEGIPRIGYADSEMGEIPFLTPLAANLRDEFYSLRWFARSGQPSGGSTKEGGGFPLARNRKSSDHSIGVREELKRDFGCLQGARYQVDCCDMPRLETLPARGPLQ